MFIWPTCDSAPIDMASTSTGRHDAAYVEVDHLWRPHYRQETSPVQPQNAADGAGQEGGHSDEYIMGWEPLMHFDARKVTPKQRRIILDKLYRRHFIVYDRLAEI